MRHLAWGTGPIARLEWLYLIQNSLKKKERKKKRRRRNGKSQISDNLTDKIDDFDNSTNTESQSLLGTWYL